MSEIDDIFDAIARKEVDDLNTKHGQHIIDVVADKQTRAPEDDPLLKVLRAMHEEKAKDKQ
jgi:hypothetical protein